MPDEKDNVVRPTAFNSPSGGEAPPMTEGISRDELSARLEAVEARNETRFERLAGDMRVSHSELAGKIDAAAAKTLDKWTAVALAIGLAALIFAMLAYGGDLFGLGLSAKEIASQAAQEAVATQPN